MATKWEYVVSTERWDPKTEAFEDETEERYSKLGKARRKVVDWLGEHPNAAEYGQLFKDEEYGVVEIEKYMDKKDDGVEYYIELVKMEA